MEDLHQILWNCYLAILKTTVALYIFRSVIHPQPSISNFGQTPRKTLNLVLKMPGKPWIFLPFYCWSHWISNMSLVQWQRTSESSKKLLTSTGLTNNLDLLGKLSLIHVILRLQLSYKKTLAQIFDNIFSHKLREAIQIIFELLVILSHFQCERKPGVFFCACSTTCFSFSSETT